MKWGGTRGFEILSTQTGMEDSRDHHSNILEGTTMTHTTHDTSNSRRIKLDTRKPTSAPDARKPQRIQLSSIHTCTGTDSCITPASTHIGQPSNDTETNFSSSHTASISENPSNQEDKSLVSANLAKGRIEDCFTRITPNPRIHWKRARETTASEDIVA